MIVFNILLVDLLKQANAVPSDETITWALSPFLYQRN